MDLGTDSTATGATQETLRRRDVSFWEIYTAYSHAVTSFFARRGVPPEECKDLTQETFLRVYKSMDTIRESFSSFVFATATNLLRNKIRDRKTHKRDGREVSLDDTHNDLPDPEEGGDGSLSPLGSILRAEELEMLRAALRELSPQMRRCVELRLYQELRYREIAVALDISIETVKAHLHQVKLQLKNRLGDYYGRLDFEDRDSRRRS